mmetsp:Transcript_7556/g.20090  ORF Transcript_7556/g.20090 Transcript_7556/m.20090 type:complete len:100 (-) Transcript_7556:4-303(-)
MPPFKHHTCLLVFSVNVKYLAFASTVASARMSTRDSRMQIKSSALQVCNLERTHWIHLSYTVGSKHTFVHALAAANFANASTSARLKTFGLANDLNSTL